MEASTVSRDIVEKANELYWGSDRSVNQIAEELDLSKGALYGMVEHELAELGCPLCGDEVGYANRTAKERGQLECLTCDWDGSADETVAATDEAPAPAELPELPPTAHDAPPEQRMRVIAGGALIGAAVGLALVFWARRR